MKPILFNTEMVKAILDGKKSVTRRAVKFSKEWNPKFSGYIPDGAVLYGSNNIPAAKSRYKPGDILWVRETWTKEGCEYFYRADFDSDFLDPCETMTGGYPYECTFHPGCEGCMRGPQRICWRPSIHMPKDASRIFLRVTNVNAERLHEINGLRAREEGCDGYVNINTLYGCPETVYNFKNIWEATIKPKDRNTYGWDANPWVWVIEFKRIGKEEAYEK